MGRCGGRKRGWGGKGRENLTSQIARCLCTSATGGWDGGSSSELEERKETEMAVSLHSPSRGHLPKRADRFSTCSTEKLERANEHTHALSSKRNVIYIYVRFKVTKETLYIYVRFKVTFVSPITHSRVRACSGSAIYPDFTRSTANTR